jgi:hypothetical protein
MTLEKSRKSYNAACGGNVPKHAADFAESARKQGVAQRDLGSVQCSPRSVASVQLWQHAAEKPPVLRMDERVLKGVWAGLTQKGPLTRPSGTSFACCRATGAPAPFVIGSKSLKGRGGDVVPYCHTHAPLLFRAGQSHMKGRPPHPGLLARPLPQGRGDRGPDRATSPNSPAGERWDGDGNLGEGASI